MAKLNEEFADNIFSVIEEIPRGKVATYGQVARLAGYEKNSRLVGKVLSMSGRSGSFPCYRVVNHKGRCVPGWENQRILLEQENITFKDDGTVDMDKHQWEL